MEISISRTDASETVKHQTSHPHHNSCQGLCVLDNLEDRCIVMLPHAQMLWCVTFTIVELEASIFQIDSSLLLVYHNPNLPFSTMRYSLFDTGLMSIITYIYNLQIDKFNFWSQHNKFAYLEFSVALTATFISRTTQFLWVADLW